MKNGFLVFPISVLGAAMVLTAGSALTVIAERGVTFTESTSDGDSSAEGRYGNPVIFVDEKKASRA